MVRKDAQLALMSLSLIGFLTCTLSASADSIIQTTTVGPLEPAPGVTFVRSYEPDVSSTRVFVTQEKPLSNSSVTTILQGPFLGIENFAHRLAMMKQQLDTGVSRGWIDSAAADNFYRRHADILAQVNLARADGISCELANSLERLLNQFNIDLSDRMSTASVGIVQ